MKSSDSKTSSRPASAMLYIPPPPELLQKKPNPFLRKDDDVVFAGPRMSASKLQAVTDRLSAARPSAALRQHNANMSAVVERTFWPAASRPASSAGSHNKNHGGGDESSTSFVRVLRRTVSAEGNGEQQHSSSRPKHLPPSAAHVAEVVPLSQVVDRLYTGPVATQQQNRTRLDRKYLSPLLETTILAADTMSSFMERNYERPLRAQHAKRPASTGDVSRGVGPTAAKKVGSSRPASSQSDRRVIERCFDKPMQEGAAERARLLDKYAPPRPPSRALSPSELQASVKRLFTGE